jgi:hypothetical protein
MLTKTSWIAILGLAACATLPAQTNLQATLLAQSNAAYSALQRGDAAALKGLLTSDSLDVEHTGVSTATDLDAEFTACKTEKYEISNPQMRVLSVDAAVLVYELHQTAACHGHPLPELMLVTDTFVLRQGMWRIAIHTEVSGVKPPVTK